jgi:hypothetical protein
LEVALQQQNPTKKNIFPKRFLRNFIEFSGTGLLCSKKQFYGLLCNSKNQQKKIFFPRDFSEISPKFHRFFSEISSNFQTQGCSAAKNSFMGCSAAEKKN